MATYKLTATLTDSNITAIRKKLADAFGEAAFTVEKVEREKSRADRLSEAEAFVADAKSIVEELRDELQEWRDNLPENLQDGEKAGQLDDAVQALDDIASSLDQAEFDDVEFPGMMG